MMVRLAAELVMQFWTIYYQAVFLFVLFVNFPLFYVVSFAS